MPQYIVWPEYLDARFPRSRGRRVPLNLASRRITREAILRACKDAGFDCEIEDGKQYPRIWFSSYGYRIIVNVPEGSRRISKEEVIKKIAKALKSVEGN